MHRDCVNKPDAAARAAERIRTLLELRKTRVPDADEVAEIIRQETFIHVSEVDELVQALGLACDAIDGLADQQAMEDGRYVAPLTYARAVLAKHR